MWKSSVSSFILWLVLSTASFAAKLDPQFANETLVLNAGLAQAKRYMDTDRCQKAVQQEIPELAGAEKLFLKEAFESKMRIVPVPYIADGSRIKGVTNCDLDPLAIVISTVNAMWEPDEVPQTIIHEYVHAISCKKILRDWGTQTRLFITAAGEMDDPQAKAAREYITELEYSAYRAGARCVGEPIPEFAKRKEAE